MSIQETTKLDADYRVYRLYRQAGLGLRLKRPRRRRMAATRRERVLATGLDQVGLHGLRQQYAVQR